MMGPGCWFKVKVSGLLALVGPSDKREVYPARLSSNNASP